MGEYKWSKREATPAGSSVLDLVEVGIAQPARADDAAGALLKELRIAAAEQRSDSSSRLAFEELPSHEQAQNGRPRRPRQRSLRQFPREAGGRDFRTLLRCPCFDSKGRREVDRRRRGT